MLENAMARAFPPHKMNQLAGCFRHLFRFVLMEYVNFKLLYDQFTLTELRFFTLLLPTDFSFVMHCKNIK